MLNVKVKKLGKIIFFDGVCNLCNWSVQFIIKHDKKSIFSFASLQSDFAKKRLAHANGQDIIYSSVVYCYNDLILTRSDAILKIIEGLNGYWRFLSVLKVVPKSWRDGVYDVIANNRYRWFGKRHKCMLPSAEISSRFLD